MEKFLKSALLCVLSTVVCSTCTLVSAEESIQTETGKIEGTGENEYKFEDETVMVTVTAPKGTVPDNAVLEAIPIDRKDVSADGVDVKENNLVYDIHFLCDGKEIEPSDTVQVSMALKVQTNDIDADSIAVQHIKDSGEVEKVADSGTKTAGTVSQEDGTVSAEFSTDSFSYFVISYNNQQQIYAHLIDQTGAEFPDTENNQVTITGSDKTYDQANFYNWNRKENVWVEMATLAATYGKYTQGYTYQSTHAGSQDGPVIKWLYYRTSENKWYYSDSDDMPASNAYISAPSLTAGSNIYCLLDKDHLAHTNIIDNVATDGSFFLERPSDIPATAEVTYRWYRSLTDTEEGFEEVPHIKVSGAEYTYDYDETGTHLYPALDMGLTEAYDEDQSIRYWYKAEVYADGVLKETTEPIHNMYYSCLQNGSFEYHDTQKLNYGAAGGFIPDGTAGLHWHTTGEDKQLEIVYAPYAKSSGGYNISDGKAPDGNQCAELNAEAAGTLYQDLMTIPGMHLFWKLYHRARQGTDTMYLLVAPTKEVEDLKTQEQLRQRVNDYLADEDGYKAKGYYLKTITDNTSSWGKWEGDYTIPEGNYLTRLFFVAGNTGSGVATVGNYIDAVSFSPLLPDPDPGYGNIEISKTVTGVSDEDIQSYRLRVDVTGGNTDKRIEFDFAKAKKIADGTYKLSDSITVPAGVAYTIAETVLTDMSAYPTGYTAAESTYQINSEDVKPYISEIRRTVAEDETVRISLVNRYQPTTVNLKITNTVTGNMGNRQLPFEYSVEIAVPDGAETTQTVKLKSGEEATIAVPYGSKVSVTQITGKAEGYKTYYKLNESDTHISEYVYTSDSLINDTAIHYFNRRSSAVSTSADGLDSGLPTCLFLLGVLALVEIVFLAIDRITKE